MGNSFKSLIKIQIKNGVFAPISSLGTNIVDYNTLEDRLVILLDGQFNSTMYKIIAENPYVSELTMFIGRFEFPIAILGKQVTVRVRSTITQEYVTLASMYSTMSSAFSSVMHLTLDPNLPTMPKSINIDYSTIQARDTIGNVNVYVGDNGQTKYYDTDLPITVNVATMSFNTSSGEYVLKLILSKVGSVIRVTPDTTNFPYLSSVSYSNNKITIVCTTTANGFLLGNITSATTGVPYQLVLNPTYSGNTITININGSSLDNVNGDFTINMTLVVTSI